MFVIFTVDNTTTTDKTYKELYDCKWDPTTMTNNTLYTQATCTHLGHKHRMTVTRGCIDTICLS